MSYATAMKFAQKIKDRGSTRDETKIKTVKALDISNHITAAKVIAN
jgi:hypothetical protein